MKNAMKEKNAEDVKKGIGREKVEKRKEIALEEET